MKSIRLFCVASALLFLVFVITAQASQSVLVADEEAKTTDEPYSVGSEFVVNSENKELGRAWVETEILGGEVDADRNRERITWRHKVPGLSFDPSTNEVVYKPEGETEGVVCGKFVEGFFIVHDIVKPTGRCKFVKQVYHRQVDDGFRVRQKVFVRVTIEIN